MKVVKLTYEECDTVVEEINQLFEVYDFTLVPGCNPTEIEFPKLTELRDGLLKINVDKSS